MVTGPSLRLSLATSRPRTPLPRTDLESADRRGGRVPQGTCWLAACPLMTPSSARMYRRSWPARAGFEREWTDPQARTSIRSMSIDIGIRSRWAVSHPFLFLSLIFFSSTFNSQPLFPPPIPTPPSPLSPSPPPPPSTPSLTLLPPPPPPHHPPSPPTHLPILPSPPLLSTLPSLHLHHHPLPTQPPLPFPYHPLHILSPTTTHPLLLHSSPSPHPHHIHTIFIT